jgi:hypothetical protein
MGDLFQRLRDASGPEGDGLPVACSSASSLSSRCSFHSKVLNKVLIARGMSTLGKPSDFLQGAQGGPRCSS